jgi:hypothetical protein
MTEGDQAGSRTWKCGRRLSAQLRAGMAQRIAHGAVVPMPAAGGRGAAGVQSARRLRGSSRRPPSPQARCSAASMRRGGWSMPR